MKKTARPNRPSRPVDRPPGIARPGPADEALAPDAPEAPEAPDAPSPGNPPQPVAAGAAGSRQSDIERVDERKSGSIESITHTPLEQGADAFVEPPGNEPDGSPLPPYQRDD